jgi:hypothetical protein
VTRTVLALASTLALVGCTERLVTPGQCPDLCPGGPVAVRDTILTAIPGLDSAFTGYTAGHNAASLLLSNGGALGETRAVIRFNPRGDSVFAGDSLKPFTTDSVVLSVFLQARDTTVTGLQVDLYRLPATFDTLTTYGEIDAAMTPATFLKTIDIPDAARNGRITAVFSGAELARFTYAPEDSTRLVLGLRLRGNAPGGVYLGGVAAGDATPLYLTYTDVEIADTTKQKPLLQRGPEQNFTRFASPPPPDLDLLQVGGFPAYRALLRFEFPEYLRDSATIIRATLELTPDAPITGIPGDSARVDARAVVADFGAKSVVNPLRTPSAWITLDTDTLQLDVASLVELWQGNDPSPSVVRLSLGQEHASFLMPRFRSTRSPGGTPPRLRITYRLPYGVEGF